MEFFDDIIIIYYEIACGTPTKCMNMLYQLLTAQLQEIWRNPARRRWNKTRLCHSIWGGEMVLWWQKMAGTIGSHRPATLSFCKMCLFVLARLCFHINISHHHIPLKLFESCLAGWCIRDGCCLSIACGDLGNFAAMRQRETDPMAPLDLCTDRPAPRFRPERSEISSQVLQRQNAFKHF